MKLSELIYRNPYIYVQKVIEKQPTLRFMAAGGFYYRELVVLDRDVIKEIQIDKPEKFKKVDFLIYTDLFLDKGLLFSYAESWKKQKNSVARQFNFQSFREKFEMIKSVVVEVRDELRHSNIQDNKEFSVSRFLMRISGEVILRGFLGKSSRDKIYFDESRNILLSEEFAEIIIEIGDQCIDVLQNLQLRFLSNKYWHNDRLLLPKQKKIKQRLLGFRKILTDKLQNQFINGNPDSQSDNMMTHFLELQKNGVLSWEEIEQQFMTFFFAGMDTTAFTSAMCFYALAKYPEELRLVRSEVAQVLGSNDEEAAKNMKFEDLSKLEYLSAVINEVMRMWPVLANLIPKLCVDDLTIDKNLHLDKATLIYIPLILSNYRKDIYEQPYEFRPSRWLNPTSEMTNSFNPFSNGPRTCIGKHLALIEIKTILVQFLSCLDPVLNPKIKLKHVQRLMNQPLDNGLIYFQNLVSSSK